ncbi:CoA-transferase [Amycolatopsis carbonis]|uniref:CoA-transferase n=1 Tax=Amycolatopsis carbonis TaxID=715471 RepID=A0A9Y2IFA2_9PSEU|nr:CoA-transferase [Amycolatopsis sp. 2-15]WIX77308.1 CoA-transferase [Amycolatopsis sp. 2-15]
MTRPFSLADAVRTHVRPGTRVYLGNFGAQLFSVGHELIRQGLRDFDAVIASGGLLLDQLLGAGVLRSATFGHCWSPVGPAPAWNFRRLAESGAGTVELHELSLGLFSSALTAGAHGVPFLPVTGLPGTGYTDEDWTGGQLATVDSPFGSATVVRAERPDVAFIHVDVVDAEGNGHIRGPLGEVLLAAQAAQRVVLVAEEVVPADEVRALGVTIPGLLVDGFARVPGAVAPDGTVGRYERDVDAYERYAERSRTPAGFQEWLADEVFAVAEVVS